MSRRGLILIPEFTVDIAKNKLQIKNIGSEPLEAMVKQNLPYWDMFDLPDNPIISTGLTPSLELLKSEGIVRKTNSRPQFSGDMAELWVRAQLEAFRLNEEKEPGAWTLTQHGDYFWLPESERVKTRVIEATLYQALPVPGQDVSFEDILEFKQLRNAELAALRSELDGLYLSLIAERDIPRATNVTLSKLVSALSSVERVTSESWATKLRSTLKIDISLTNISTGAIAGATAATSFTLPIWLGAGMGAVASVLKFELKPESAGAKPLGGKPQLTYARRVGRDLGQA